MDTLHNSVLVLNSSYEAVNVVTVKRAFILICKGAAIVQESSGQVLHTSRMALPVPAVIRLLVYRAVPKHTRSVSRKSIMIRDSYTCQYCHATLPAAKLTLDHVTPKSKGGKSTWENLVAACYPCNNRKGNRTPVESRMVLLKQPKQFSLHARHKLLSQGSDLWGRYLFY
jgi:5-methylcytosine-specific restriction endonuclease McrA